MASSNSILHTSFLWALIFLTFVNKAAMTPTTPTTTTTKDSSKEPQAIVLNDSSQLNCPVQPQEIKVCDLIKDSASIAASVLQSLPHLEGPKGEPGPEGPQGNVGEKGQRGDKGDPGISVMGQKGQQGLKGSNGEKGDRGYQGYQGYKGSQGIGQKGQKGQQGYKGQKGAPQDPPRMSAFSVHRTDSMHAKNGDEVITYTQEQPLTLAMT